VKAQEVVSSRRVQLDSNHTFFSLFVLRTLRYSCKEQTRCRTETLPLRPLVPRLSDESLEKIRQDLPRPEYGHKACLVSTRKLQRFLRSSNSIFQVLPARIALAHLRPGRSPHFFPPSRSLAALGNSSSTWTNRRLFFFELMRGVCPQAECRSAQRSATPRRTNQLALPSTTLGKIPPCGPLLLCAEIPQTQSEAT
jgi:hypothetical protein